MGSIPTFPGQKTQAEPLSGPNRQLVEIPAREIDGRDARRLFYDIGYAQAVPQRDHDRLSEAKHKQRPECQHVKPDPVSLGDAIGGEVHSDE